VVRLEGFDGFETRRLGDSETLGFWRRMRRRIRTRMEIIR
jgi:hypothetical protein